MKYYRVQDLANYNREITVDGQIIKFDGHWATVPEPVIYYFNRLDEYQVSTPTEVTTPVAQVEAPKEEPVKIPETKGEPTISPNIQEITKPRDDTPKPEPVKITEQPVKPRIAEK